MTSQYTETFRGGAASPTDLDDVDKTLTTKPNEQRSHKGDA